MERGRDEVLEAVRQDARALQDAPESCKSDHEIVLTAVKRDGMALQWAAEGCRSDREIVLTAVKQTGNAIEWAGEACTNDPEIALTAWQRWRGWGSSALEWVGDELWEDHSFLRRERRGLEILKVTLLSGRRTYVVIERSLYRFAGLPAKRYVVEQCCRRLGLEYSASMKLLHGSEEVPADVEVDYWPGIQHGGQVSEYQLVV
mmetsp:Transcript_50280/g.92930  ORF Transcript_50280/g.92930 Transcript_50280/m.92930 type:complete len:203 (-) Transcript_50280:60-668(-)